MNNKSIHDLHYLLVKAHFQCPEQSPLPKSKQEILNRARAAAKILDGNPVRKNAVALLRALYPEISRATAFRDLILAESLFPSFRTFNYDLWNTFLRNSIVETIQRCKAINTIASLELLIKAHAILKLVIGDKPKNFPDPEDDGKRTYYIIVQDNVKKNKIDIRRLKDLPEGVIQDYDPSLWAGEVIAETENEKRKHNGP
jgi:hypothetical protein